MLTVGQIEIIFGLDFQGCSCSCVYIDSFYEVIFCVMELEILCHEDFSERIAGGWNFFFFFYGYAFLVGKLVALEARSPKMVMLYLPIL